MGQVKNNAADEQDEAAAAWARKAQHEDYRCEMCGRAIEYIDREAYFGTKRCAECANYAGKSD
jgi:RNA polymerase-binding transcription factor DksA